MFRPGTETGLAASQAEPPRIRWASKRLVSRLIPVGDARAFHERDNKGNNHRDAAHIKAAKSGTHSRLPIMRSGDRGCECNARTEPCNKEGSHCMQHGFHNSL